MQKFILSLLLSIVVAVAPAFAMQGIPQSNYVAVFTSEEWSETWSDKYEPDMKYVYRSWDDLPVFIEMALKRSQGKTLVLDIDVHGNDHGLALEDRNNHYLRASVGYLYTCLEKKLRGKDCIVLLEACYPGNAYYKTIRGNKHEEGDHLDNYPNYPDIPVYCVGSGFSNIDKTMFLQFKHNFRLWWEDIRDYEGNTPKSHEIYLYPFSLTTNMIYDFNVWIQNNLP